MTPEVLAIGGVVIGTALLTLVLVREAGSDDGNASRPRRFRAPLMDQRPFVALVAARFLFLLGTFAVGRFLLLLVAERRGLEPVAVANEAAAILAVLALLTAGAALPGGWLADRLGRVETMVLGGVAGTTGVVLLIWASSFAEIALVGSLMAVGTALFTSANWAMTTDVVPSDEAGRFMGLANVGTVGAAAVAGLLGPLADGLRLAFPQLGYNGVLVMSAAAMALSVVAVRIVHTDRAMPAMRDEPLAAA
jgi:MFS family permease